MRYLEGMPIPNTQKRELYKDSTLSPAHAIKQAIAHTDILAHDPNNSVIPNTSVFKITTAEADEKQLRLTLGKTTVSLNSTQMDNRLQVRFFGIGELQTAHISEADFDQGNYQEHVKDTTTGSPTLTERVSAVVARSLVAMIEERITRGELEPSIEEKALVNALCILSEAIEMRPSDLTIQYNTTNVLSQHGRVGSKLFTLSTSDSGTTIDRTIHYNDRGIKTDEQQTTSINNGNIYAQDEDLSQGKITLLRLEYLAILSTLYKTTLITPKEQQALHSQLLKGTSAELATSELTYIMTPEEKREMQLQLAKVLATFSPYGNRLD